MKERPILFTPSNALLVALGSKTQTRRVMKSQPYTLRTEGFGYPTKAGGFVSLQSEHCLKECPQGLPGDRLWVREAWIGGENRTLYKGDFGSAEVDWKWRNGMFMPRWAARTILEITEVRVERVQDISEKDAKAEGARWIGPQFMYPDEPLSEYNYRRGFEELWDSINAEKHPWASNPFVWAISFKRVQDAK